MTQTSPSFSRALDLINKLIHNGLVVWVSQVPRNPSIPHLAKGPGLPWRVALCGRGAGEDWRQRFFESRAQRHRVVHRDRLGLAYAVGAVGRLGLFGRIPMTRVVNDVIR